MHTVLPLLGLFSSARTALLPGFEQFRAIVANGLSPSEQCLQYDYLMIPESRKLMRHALTPLARIDFDRPHAQLLFLARSDDRLMPPALNQANYWRYRYHASRTDCPAAATPCWASPLGATTTPNWY